MDDVFVILDRNSKVPLKKQVYDTIIGEILSGRLKAGEKLPSTRELSSDLNLARNTVVEIYEQLVAEGYLTIIQGKGTFVASLEIEPIRFPKKNDEIYLPAKKNNIISFECGIPDLSSFPRNVWVGFMKESMLEIYNQECGYDHILGYKPLRIEIADYLHKYKGISCSSSQILISAGTSDAIAFLSLLFRNKCEYFLHEEYTVPFIPDIFRIQGYKLQSLAVDMEGVIPTDFPEISHSVICISPSHQFPLGGTLPFERRKVICDWLKRNQNYLIEDDYDSEFRYKGANVNSLYQLSPEHVIHLGTFSKTLMPGLRLGYIVLPESLLNEAKMLRFLLQRRIDILNQMALYKMFSSSKFLKHIYKMKKNYNCKMQLITRKLRELFGNEIDIYGESCGLHIAVSFRNYKFDQKFSALLIQNGLYIELLSDYQKKSSKDTNILIFGFGNTQPKEIETGLVKLRDILLSLGGVVY